MTTSFAHQSHRLVAKCLMLGLILSASVMGPVYAQTKNAAEGEVTIYTRTGGIIQQKITNQAMLDSLTKDSMVIPEGGAIMMHGGKWYLVMNHKMSDGTMLLDSMAKQ